MKPSAHPILWVVSRINLCRGVQPLGVSGPHWKKSCLGLHIKYTNTNENKKKSHHVLSKFMILCWAKFIAILSCKGPMGRRLDTPDGVFTSRSRWNHKHSISLWPYLPGKTQKSLHCMRFSYLEQGWYRGGRVWGPVVVPPLFSFLCVCVMERRLSSGKIGEWWGEVGMIQLIRHSATLSKVPTCPQMQADFYCSQ